MKFEASDHRPIHSVFSTTMKKSRRLFRYDRRLKDIPEVGTLIKTTWDSAPSASVSHRLALCRRAIVGWSRHHHTDGRKAIDVLKVDIDKAMSAPSSDESVLLAINTALLAAYKADEYFWKQRSRLLWMALGDKNTSFFHAVSKGRRARNKLTLLENSDGNVVYEEHQMATEIAR